MKALILGIVVILVAVLTVLPAGLGWWEEVLAFLRGSLPILSLLIGLVLIFTGISDIKDRAEAKKEDAKKNGSQDDTATPGPT